MIEFTKSYKTADGQVFGSIEDAQQHEVESLLAKSDCPLNNLGIAKFILANKTVLIDILTTTPNSKPKARTTHGGTKNRKKTLVTDASASTTSTTNVPTSA